MKSRRTKQNNSKPKGQLSLLPPAVDSEVEAYAHMALSSLLFMQMLLNRETWRHSYGRKLYRGRLEKFELRVPIDGCSKIDQAGILTWPEANPIWEEVEGSLLEGLPSVRQETLALMMDSGG